MEHLHERQGNFPPETRTALDGLEEVYSSLRAPRLTLSQESAQPNVNSHQTKGIWEYKPLEGSNPLHNSSDYFWSEVTSPASVGDILEQDAEGLESFVYTFSDIMGIWITGAVCLLGFLGNVISFVVLLQAFKRSPMFYVLRAVAISDAIFLFSVFVMQTLVNTYPYTGFFYWCYTYRGYIQWVMWPVLMVTQMSTVWLTVLVSAERYIAICFPFKAASLCTIAKMRRAVLLICMFSLLYNIPRFFEHQVISHIYLAKNSIGAHRIYRYLYSCILYSLLLFFLPLGLLITLNAKLIYSLESGRRQWQRLSCNQKREQVITIIPLCVVVMFCICGTPALIVNIIDSLFPDIYDYYPHFVTLMVVANLLVVLNSTCNFIIYCLLGKKFRSRLLDLCHCKRPQYRVVHQLLGSQFTATQEGSTTF